MTMVSEAAAVSPMIAAAGSETIMEGSTVMKPPMKFVLHSKPVFMFVMNGRYSPSGKKKAVYCK
jgi:hypothetical protein